jgi:nucleoside-diphosphate-sugar epimerase
VDGEHERADSLVIGATGVVGGFLLRGLIARGEHPFAMSRTPRPADSARWIVGDLTQPAQLQLPTVATLYCTADASLLAQVLDRFCTPSLKRLVVFSSTSVMTKMDSEIAAERKALARLSDAEQEIAAICEASKVEWTILRPTLIYAEGSDSNITPLSRLIRRFGFMPLVGGAAGLRQPVHAEDLADGAIAAAASPAAANQIYSLAGLETISYREMIGRIFDGMKLPRRMLPVPAWLWRAAFLIAKPLYPTANVAMGIRMMKDMTFDASPAVKDFGWKPRPFRPVFEKNT